MNYELSLLTEQMFSVAILVAVGFLAGKLGVLTPGALEHLAKVISKVLLPALIVTMIPFENGREELLKSLPVVAAALCIILTLFAAGILTARLGKLRGTTRNIHLVCSSFGNIGLMGIPVISAVYGQMGLLFLSLYIIVDQTLLWTLGNLYLYRDTGNRQGFQLKKLLNPTTIALAVGLLLLLLNVNTTGVVFRTVETLGSATKPLAMVYLGGALCALKLSKLRGQWSIFLLAGVKMVAIPLGVWLVLGLFPQWFSQMSRMVLTLAAGMPTMLTVSMMAQTAGSDWEYASHATLFTTLVSLGSLPLVSWLVALIG